MPSEKTRGLLIQDFFSQAGCLTCMSLNIQCQNTEERRRAPILPADISMASDEVVTIAILSAKTMEWTHVREERVGGGVRRCCTHPLVVPTHLVTVERRRPIGR